jgi:hypothetical protein
MKVAVRVLHSFQLMEENHDQIPRIEITWWPDGQHFMTHPKILGEFLGLKPNPSISRDQLCS